MEDCYNVLHGHNYYCHVIHFLDMAEMVSADSVCTKVGDRYF